MFVVGNSSVHAGGLSWQLPLVTQLRGAGNLPDQISQKSIVRSQETELQLTPDSRQLTPAESRGSHVS